MFLIAWRNLFGEKGRLLITVGGVAFAVMLIFILSGLYLGWDKQMTRFTGNIDTTYWVGQAGSGDLSHSISLLPRSLGSQLMSEPYVEELSVFFGRQTGVSANGKDVHIFVVGTDEKDFIRPYKLIEGSDKPAPGEIAIDLSLSRAQKLPLGSRMKVTNRDLTVTGIISGGNILAYSFALTHPDDAKAIFGSDDLVNYFLVRSNDPTAKEKMERDFPDLKIMPKAEYLENNKSILTETFLPIVGVLLAIALAVGIAVIGLTIYTATVEKSREFGVLKAIGYTNASLYGVAVIQSVSAGIIGFIIGAILAPFVAWAASFIAGGFLYELGAREIAVIFAVTILMSVLASLLPLRRLFRIDPAQVFKA